MSDDPNNNQLNEPIGIYQSKKVAVYRSFEEENEATYAYYAGLSPVECMQQLNYLLKQTYGAAFGPEKTLGRKIYFD